MLGAPSKDSMLCLHTFAHLQVASIDRSHSMRRSILMIPQNMPPQGYLFPISNVVFMTWCTISQANVTNDSMRSLYLHLNPTCACDSFPVMFVGRCSPETHRFPRSSGRLLLVQNHRLQRLLQLRATTSSPWCCWSGDHMTHGSFILAVSLQNRLVKRNAACEEWC